MTRPLPFARLAVTPPAIHACVALFVEMACGTMRLHSFGIGVIARDWTTALPVATPALGDGGLR